MLKNQTQEKNQESEYFVKAMKYYNSSTKLKNSMKTVRTQSLLVSNSQNFQNLKKFMEDDHIITVNRLDEAEALEKNITAE